MGALHDFLSKYPTKYIPAGELLLLQGEVPREIYVVRKGLIKSYNISTDGVEMPIGFYVHDEIIPIEWLMGKVPAALYFYETISDCEIYKVPPEELLSWLKTNKEELYKVFELFVGSFVGKNMRLNALQYSKARDKQLHTLYYLCLGYGRKLTPTTTLIELPLTHLTLANLTGLTRETTAVELKRLANEKIISYAKQEYKVNMPKLIDAINDDFYKDLDIKLT